MKNSRSADLNRRHFLANLGGALGAYGATRVLSTASLGVALSYPRDVQAAPARALLSATQMHCLHALCAQVIPATNTPGAAEENCHGVIDQLLSQCYDKADQQLVLTLLDQLDSVSQARYQSVYGSATLDQQQALLALLDARQAPFASLDFSLLKSLIVFSFFTSKAGASVVLKYQPIPGGFSVIPYRDGDRAWGSHARY